MKIGEHETHPAADVFPLLHGAEFDRLVADIGEHGLREPIWRVWVDDPISPGTRAPQILDGRNRLRACHQACVKPTFRDYEGDDPIAFVLSLNLARRHLSESQRAMVAAKVATLPGHRPKAADLPASVPTQAQAAEQVNVSERSVRAAREVLTKADPEIVAAVERGSVAVSAAAAVAKLPIDEQRALVDAGPAAVKAKAKEMREERARFVTAVESHPAMTDDEKSIVIGETSDGEDDDEWDAVIATREVYDAIGSAWDAWPRDESIAPLEACLRGWLGRIEQRRKGAA